MLKTPESYLAILAESSQPRVHVLADKPNMHERQNLALLDALAEICVSQEGEAYASALELNVERCSLFIVGNQEQVPQRTQEYLADLCRRLTNIANVADARRPSDKDFPPMIRDSIDEIYRAVLSFTFPKLLARLTKWNDSWCDRIVDIDEIQLAEADRKKFGDLTQALNSLYRVATSFKDPLDVEDAKILDNIVGSVSEEWYLNNSDTATFVHMLDALLTNDGNSTPFSIERYLQKILKTYDQTTKLVDFALSSRHGCIFQNQLELVFLNSQTRHVELNIQGAINKVELQMITTREDRVYLDRLKDQQLEERYARLRLTGSDLPIRFAITGARNTACVPWVSPDLTAIDPGLHAGIQRRLLTLVQEASTAHTSAHRGTPYSAARRCPARLEIDADGQAVMVDLGMVQLGDLPDRLTVDRFRSKFVNGISSEYFYDWFRDLRQ
ncbi:hypothetical protein ARMGADRAFT_1062064 [Armillaria gallica]|uniref:Uncharacterized protein n=1 Tax=Armillaria gallica TaxID=47427 RepID=A0A2H3DVG9_ARMGA|nr:hypothetical protein ARMGADRAFT_1062064 [Armillaria gallica]